MYSKCCGRQLQSEDFTSTKRAEAVRRPYSRQSRPASNQDLKDTGTASAALNLWTHLAVTWSTSTGTANFYVNGALNSTQTNSAIVEHASGTEPYDIGALRNGIGFPGVMDEIHVSNAIRAAAWIATEFNNQNNPQSFYGVGPQQTSTGGSTLPITVNSSPSGLSLSVDGTSSSAPCSFQWNSGTNHTIAVITTPQGGAT